MSSHITPRAGEGDGMFAIFSVLTTLSISWESSLKVRNRPTLGVIRQVMRPSEFTLVAQNAKNQPLSSSSSSMPSKKSAT